MTILLRQSFYHFHYNFFYDENSDRIKFDGHHRLKLKKIKKIPLNMAKLGNIIYQNLLKCLPKSNGEVCFYPRGHFRKLTPKTLI